MNAYSDVLSSIRSKTYTFFFLSAVFYCLLSMVVSFISYRMVSADYNIQFYIDYILNNSILFIFNNLVIYAASFFMIMYSMIIKREDLINKENKKVLFSDIISSGLYILIILTLLLFLGQEFLVPKAYDKLAAIKSNTKLSDTLLKLANSSYDNSNFEQALKYYNDYTYIIENDFVKERIRELKVKTANDELERRKSLSKNTGYITPNDLDYIKLAQISYDKEDYIGALYYYQYVLETYNYSKRQSNQRDVAEKRIQEIKKILQFKDSMLTDDKFQDKIDQNLKDISKIYNLKREAEIAKSREDYFSAYFLYSDILDINSDLRDAVQEKNDAFYKISLIGVDYDSVSNAKLLPSRDNIVFMYDSGLLMSAKKMVRALDLGKNIYTYYMYDIRFFKYDSQFNLNYVSYAPYGEIKNYSSIYQFIKDNSNTKNMNGSFEIPYIIKKRDFESFTSKIAETDKHFLSSIYTLSDDKYKILRNVTTEEKDSIFSIFSRNGYDLSVFFNNTYFLTLFSGSTTDRNMEFIPIPEILSKKSYNAILNSLPSNLKSALNSNYNIEDDNLYHIKSGYNDAYVSNLIKKSGYNVKSDLFGISEKNFIFPLPISPSLLYDFSFEYQDMLRLPFSKLVKLEQWSEANIEEGINNGFSFDTIETAVANKISNIFLFFSLSLLAISIGWLFRSTAISVSIGYYLYAIFIPLFVYVVVSLCTIFNTKLYSTLMQVLPFGLMVVVALALNIIFAVASIFVVSASS